MSSAKQPQVKKIPMRQCMGCSEHKPKRELLRVVLSPDGEISLDFTGKKSGRGAYVCRDAKCLSKARKSKRLEKSLNHEISEDVYLKLEAELSENE
ncbi:MAG: YlxR family protein [Ruminococcaceae bacterium]|nr:YlxR family protein [Oscillospiraceae bacterium]